MNRRVLWNQERICGLDDNGNKQENIVFDRVLWLILGMSFMILTFFVMLSLFRVERRVLFSFDLIISMHVAIVVLYAISAKNKVHRIIHVCTQLLLILSIYLSIFLYAAWNVGLFMLFPLIGVFLNHLYLVISFISIIVFCMFAFNCLILKGGNVYEEKKHISGN